MSNEIESPQHIAIITIQQDAQGFQENKEAAHAGGKIAGNEGKSLKKKVVERL